MPGRIDLVLPGLFEIPPAECDAARLEHGLPHLNYLLRFARERDNRSFSIDAILRDVLRSDGEPGANAPVAMARAAAGDEETPGTRLLLFKPVYLQTGLHNALIVPIPGDDDTRKELDIIINDLKDLFNVDCDIEHLFEDTYLMRLKAIDAPVGYPHILSVLGKPMNPYIAQTRDNLPWYKLLNEMQMFMHQHEINHERVLRGSLAINSLWCWGAGELPRPPNPPQAWYVDDELLARFAKSLDLNPRPLARIDGAAAGGDLVAVDLRLLEGLKSGSAAPFDSLLEDIDANLLRPLLTRVRRHRERLRLRAGHDFDYEIGPNSKLRFWRRERNLGSCLRQGEAD